MLVLGGYGLFGRRLAARLLARQGLHVIVAGRSAPAGAALVRELGAAHPGASLASVQLDATSPTLAAEIAALAPRVVVHTAGPFQGQDAAVARACIAAGVHYVDLADGRAFVEGIAALDAAARAASVVVLAGASSVPALSGAVVDALARGMQVVEHVDIGISPGNRTERGLSTVQAVLSYCGQPIEAAGQPPLHGWCGTWHHDYPAPVGRRLLSPCDVPDLALLPPRHAGSPQVRFGAGLELRLLHRGMNLMAWLARRGWVRRWDRHARWLHRASTWFQHQGSDAGAMHVQVRGRDAQGAELSRTWTLLATGGDGPSVPTLAAAAAVARLVAGPSLAPGARPCVGCLGLDEILAQARGLAITTHTAGSAGDIR